MKLVAYSSEDPAGGNIARILKESFGFRDTSEEFDGTPVFAREDVLLVESKESILYRDEFGGLDPEVLIVVSRHKSESMDPTLTAHVTGNFGSADFGGLSGKLSIAPARELSHAVELLKLNVGALPYRVSLEVTHHGPSELSFPMIYIEVGSSEKQWLDENACLVVAECVDKLLFEPISEKPVVIGFGGPHYAPNFTKHTNKVCFGHIMPKYAIDFLNKPMVEQMIERTTPKPEFAALDWKGLKSAERKKLIEILDEIDLPWKKTSELKQSELK